MSRCGPQVTGHAVVVRAEETHHRRPVALGATVGSAYRRSRAAVRAALAARRASASLTRSRVYWRAICSATYAGVAIMVSSEVSGPAVYRHLDSRRKTGNANLEISLSLVSHGTEPGHGRRQPV
jgi:hypothetical protein